jgi:hypothetical protein
LGKKEVGGVAEFFCARLVTGAEEEDTSGRSVSALLPNHQSEIFVVNPPKEEEERGGRGGAGI